MYSRGDQVTGSTRQDALPATAQALTGRLHSLTIWPLSQGEIAGVREDLLETLWVDPAEAIEGSATSTTTRASYVERVCAGGLPLALRRPRAARARWFDDFVRASVERDALELSRIRERQAMADLLALVAAQTGQLLNVSAAADRLGVARPTVEGHLRLLEDLFLVVRLPAWGRTLRSRVSVKPKVHVVDSGLAARLLRLSAEKISGLDPASLTSATCWRPSRWENSANKHRGWNSRSPWAIGAPATVLRSMWSSKGMTGESSPSRSRPANEHPGRTFGACPSFATLWDNGSSQESSSPRVRAHTRTTIASTSCPSTGSGRQCMPPPHRDIFLGTHMGAGDMSDGP